MWFRKSSALNSFALDVPRAVVRIALAYVPHILAIVSTENAHKLTDGGGGVVMLFACASQTHGDHCKLNTIANLCTVICKMRKATAHIALRLRLFGGQILSK